MRYFKKLNESFDRVLGIKEDTNNVDLTALTPQELVKGVIEEFKNEFFEFDDFGGEGGIDAMLLPDGTILLPEPREELKYESDYDIENFDWFLEELLGIEENFVNFTGSIHLYNPLETEAFEIHLSLKHPTQKQYDVIKDSVKGYIDFSNSEPLHPFHIYKPNSERYVIINTRDPEALVKAIKNYYSSGTLREDVNDIELQVTSDKETKESVLETAKKYFFVLRPTGVWNRQFMILPDGLQLSSVINDNDEEAPNIDGPQYDASGEERYNHIVDYFDSLFGNFMDITESVAIVPVSGMRERSPFLIYLNSKRINETQYKIIQMNVKSKAEQYEDINLYFRIYKPNKEFINLTRKPGEDPKAFADNIINTIKNFYSTGTLKEDIDFGVLPNEDLKENVVDVSWSQIYKLIKDEFGVTTTPPKFSSYILPTGEFLDLEGWWKKIHSSKEKNINDVIIQRLFKGISDKYIKDLGSPGSFPVHSYVQYFINYKFKGYIRSFFGNFGTLVEKGCIQLNSGETVKGNLYVALPDKKPTEQALKSLDEYIFTNFFENNKENIRVYAGGTTFLYEREDYPDTSEIIKKIRKYYTTKRFDESYNNIKQKIKDVIKQGDFGQYLPKFLYHATFSGTLDSIKKNGLGSLKHGYKSLWRLQYEQGVYLDTDADSAESFVEGSDDDRLDTESIVVFKIPTSKLDHSLIEIDWNNDWNTDIIEDREFKSLKEYFNSITYFYGGVIPFADLIPMDKLNEDIDHREVYKSLTFSDTPKLGPIFISRDGEFVNVNPEGAHSEIFGKEDYSGDDYYTLHDAFGLIKANSGNKIEPYAYIDLWVVPNPAQKKAIIDWMYFLIENGRKNIQINTPWMSKTGDFSSDSNKIYSLESDIPEDIYDDVVRSL